MVIKTVDQNWFRKTNLTLSKLDDQYWFQKCNRSETFSKTHCLQHDYEIQTSNFERIQCGINYTGTKECDMVVIRIWNFESAKKLIVAIWRWLYNKID